MARKIFLLTWLGLVLCTGLSARPANAQSVPPAHVQITELLPNPSPQPDDEAEYVELYNPNDVAVDLSIYTLHTGSQNSTRQKALTGLVLQPREYRAFYASETGLNLVNSATGQAWLVGPGFVRVSETPWYPATLGENEAWALLENIWQATTTLSPGAANPLPTPEPPADQAPQEQELEPCPPGKFRNPETNRCKNIEEEATLQPCGPGQERNPATNRCRSLATAEPQLTPCDPGEERNPDTNRCRKATVTATTPSSCQTGYERNPETNRCRKIQAVKASTTNKPGGGTSQLNYQLIGGVSALVLGYAVYEYRKDLMTMYGRFKNYIKPAAK